MKIVPIRFDNFKVPCKDMINHPDWKGIYPSDENGLANWALRSILIISADRNILIDTGFGNKQSKTFFNDFQLNGGFSLEVQLLNLGLETKDISDVILTHLHFDHCGGCLLKNDNAILPTFPTFPNATLWISKEQWVNALSPIDLEKDSFLLENILGLPDFYKINFISTGENYLPGITFKLVSGHTKGQIIPIVETRNQNFLFGADLFPSVAHLRPEINMVYDIDPQQAAIEKASVLQEACDKGWIILFQHDLYNEGCSIKQLEDRVVVDKIAKLPYFL